MIRKYNTVNKWLGRIQDDFDGLTLAENEVKLSVSIQPPPTYDPETQRIEKVIDIDLDIFQYIEAWIIHQLTEAEITSRRNSQAESIDQQLDTQLIKDDLKGKVVDLPNNVDKYMTLYPYYRVGQLYELSDIVQYKNELYEVIQLHTSQFDWKPDELPALYKRLRITVEAWVQPEGAHDSYQIGDIVTHNGSTWESTAADNVWEPGIFGWIEI